MASPLLRFLSQTRSAILHQHSKAPPSPIVLVLGNPSCDLDSFISATLYAFFQSRFSWQAQAPCLHIPLLNLPTTSSSELWRLSPEFGIALGAAVNGRTRTAPGGAEDEDKTLLESLITISDIRSAPSSPLHALFAPQALSPPEAETDVVLVDHNALSTPLPEKDSSRVSAHLNVVGCIDHHDDETATSPSISPRIIQTGIGSCTTLVVQYLRDHNFWDRLTQPQQPQPQHQQNGPSYQDTLTEKHHHHDENTVAAVELATLALAAILSDTANLTAAGKVSPLDRQVVTFLEDLIVSRTGAASSSSIVHPTQHSPKSQHEWNRGVFYRQIWKSRQDAPNRLTLTEILARDYKSWVEQSGDGAQKKKIRLGISGVVKPVDWLIERKAEGSGRRLVEGLRAYAEEEELDILAVMTIYTATSASSDDKSAIAGAGTSEGDGEWKGENEHDGPGMAFARELLLLPITTTTTIHDNNDESDHQIHHSIIATFEALAGQELKLQRWLTESSDRDGLLHALATTSGGGSADGKGDEAFTAGAGGRIWRQGDLTKSRKQVAPLLRQACRQACPLTC